MRIIDVPKRFEIANLRMLLQGPLTWIFVSVLSALVCNPTRAADTVIGFDNLPPNTGVTHQYLAEGVDFGFPPYAALAPTSQIPTIWCCLPSIRLAPAGHPSQVASISTSGSEFFHAGTFGIFSNFHKKVQVTIGNFSASDSTQVSLSAFDVNGALVGQTMSATVTGAVPVTLLVTDPAPTPSIAYFLVRSSDTNKLLWIDDLTFDNPTVGTPDFQFDMQGIVNAGSASYVAQGGSIVVPIAVRRLNGSNGHIALHASGLPQGVTPSFPHFHLFGTSVLTHMTLSVDPTAPLVSSASFTVTGIPANSAVGSAQRQVQLQVTVTAPMVISTSGWGTTYNLAPCTPLVIAPIYVLKDTTVGIGDVTLVLRGYDQTNGVTTDLLPGIHASFNSPISPQTSGFTMHTLNISLDPGTLRGWNQLDLVVEGTSGGLTVLSQPFTIHGEEDEVDVVPLFGIIPNLTTGQPGTKVVIKGNGFCPGTRVSFGNDIATVSPDSLTPTEIQATVPLLATDGAPGPLESTIALVEPSGRRLAPLYPTRTPIDSYRNTSGYSFHNYIPDLTFGQLTEAFGSDQTQLQVPLCWPFDCTVNFEDPNARIWLQILKQYLDVPHGGGACFGIALSAQRFLASQRPLSDFPSHPTPATNLFSLDVPNAPSPALRDYINSQSTVQVSVQFLTDYINQSVGNSTGQTSNVLVEIHNKIHDSLAAGESPMISVYYGEITSRKGHTVTAYDLEDMSANPIDYFIKTYDPDIEFTSLENSDTTGGTHQGATQSSRIHITSDGTWSIPGTNKTGSVQNLIVTRASSIPLNPSLPGSQAAQLLNAGSITIFGSLGDTSPGGQSGGIRTSRTTQLVDGIGHTLFDADGQLNRDPATRLKAAPFVPFSAVQPSGEIFAVAPNSGPLVQSVTGTSSGPDTHFLIGAGVTALITTEATIGVMDQIGFDPKGTVSFGTQDSRKPLSIGIVIRDGAITRSAEFTTTSSQGTLDEMQFDEARTSIIIRHNGPTAPLRLRLSSLATQGGIATFDSGPMMIGAGNTVTFAASDWTRLDSILMIVQSPSGNHQRTFLQNHLTAKPLASIVGFDIDGVVDKPRSRRIEIISKLDKLPPDPQVAITWMIRKSGHIVGHEVRMLSETDLHPGERRDSYVFDAPSDGRYDVTASIVVLTAEGVIQTAHRNSKSTSFDLDVR